MPTVSPKNCKKHNKQTDKVGSNTSEVVTSGGVLREVPFLSLFPKLCDTTDEEGQSGGT